MHSPGERGRFSHLLPFGGEYELLRHHARAFRDGREEPLGELDRSLASGATIFFKNVAKKLPAVGELVAGVNAATRSRQTQAALVMTRGELVGYECHQDAFELVVLQLLGRKMWTVYAAERCKDVAWRGVLQDGDMLYVPENWWHFCEPRGLGAHLTISFRRCFHSTP